MHYLSLSVCIKEEFEIEDFVRIHECLGVDAFIFYDRDGDNLTNKFRGKDNITVIKFPEPHRHHESHLHTIRNFQNHSKWIAFIDADQVLFSPTNTDLKVTMQQYEPYAQVQPVWHTFGDNGHEFKTDGTVYERFTKRAVDDAGVNNHTQGIADVRKCQAALPPDPHRVLVKPNQFSVDENFRNVGSTPHISPHSQNKLFVAHYISKSKEEWITKNNKGRSDVIGTKMDFSLFDTHSKFCNAVEDTRIKDFWEKNCK